MALNSPEVIGTNKLCIQKIFCHALTRGATGNFTVKGMSYASQIEPALCCRYVDDVGDPYIHRDVLPRNYAPKGHPLPEVYV